MAGIRDALRAFFTIPASAEPPNERGLTFAQVWGSGAEWSPVNATAGVTVDTETALRSIAVQAAVRLLTNDIGSLPVDAYRTLEQGRKELTKPSWVVTPIPNNPNVTWEDHVKQTVFGMLTDGNAFTYCFPSVFDPQAIRSLDPKDVDIKGGAGFGDVSYQVRGLSETLTPNEILHLPWMVPSGKNRGINPIEAAKQGLGIALASDEFVGSYFGNGAILSGVIQYPQGVDPTPEQVEGLKRDFAQKHVGARKSHAVGALTGGAEYKPFDYNNRNAQLLELRDQIVEEVARLFGIPPHMLGSQKPGAVAYASVEQRSIDYVTHAVLPIVRRIESGYSRLLRGQRTYLRFNMEGLLRGDSQGRAAFYTSLLNGKVLRREEVREKEDLPFDPEGVGYLETPNNNAPDSSAPARDLLEWMERRDTRPPEPAPSFTFHVPELRVPEMPPSQVTVNVPEQPTPQVTVNVAPADLRVEPPTINVEPTPITIENRQEPPQVTVTTPDTIRIASMPNRIRTRRVKRNADQQITETQEVEEDAP